MLSKVMQDTLNEHVNHEYHSSYIYQSMSAYCEYINLPGFARWLRERSENKERNARRSLDFINDRKNQVALEPITQPPVEFQSVLDVMQKALEHERQMTEAIHRFYQAAVNEGDYATQVHLQQFIGEQVQGERATDLILEQLRMIANQPDALLLLDRELARG
jgi:ferritin